MVMVLSSRAAGFSSVLLFFDRPSGSVGLNQHVRKRCKSRRRRAAWRDMNGRAHADRLIRSGRCR